MKDLHHFAIDFTLDFHCRFFRPVQYTADDLFWIQSIGVSALKAYAHGALPDGLVQVGHELKDRFRRFATELL